MGRNIGVPSGNPVSQDWTCFIRTVSTRRNIGTCCTHAPQSLHVPASSRTPGQHGLSTAAITAAPLHTEHMSRVPLQHTPWKSRAVTPAGQQDPSSATGPPLHGQEMIQGQESDTRAGTRQCCLHAFDACTICRFQRHTCNEVSTPRRRGRLCCWSIRCRRWGGRVHDRVKACGCPGGRVGWWR